MVISYSRENAEKLANACLIAAAPDLLAACKAALPWLADHVALTCRYAECFDVRDRQAHDLVEAAIAKAEGQST